MTGKTQRRRVSGWTETRETFRHGNLPEALVEAALKRLEQEGAAALSLRELARDAGVNHRAVYRHFPDKLSLLARVAEEGYRRMAASMAKELGPGMRGEDALVAAGVGCFRFARDNPGLMTLMSGPRLNEQGAFPALEALITETLTPFIRGFVELGTDPAVARLRGVLYLFALLGITEQIRHRRLRVTPKSAAEFLAEVSKMLIKGLR
jgi:AcrR family transcriptional regulator